MYTINKEKCVRCGACIRVCPFAVLGADEANGCVPFFKEDKENRCVHCYHCTAICKKDALDFGPVPEAGRHKADLSCLKGETDQTQNEKQNYDVLKAFLKHKRSIRNYNTRPVNKELIKDVIETSQWAPSAKNQHPARYVVISGKDNLDQVMKLSLEYIEESGVSPDAADEYREGNNVVTCNAPHLLIAYAPEQSINPAADTAIALTYIELLFHAEGIGTCWAGYLTRFINGCKELSDYIGIPEGCRVYGALMFGYPDKEQYDKIPGRAAPDIKWHG